MAEPSFRPLYSSSRAVIIGINNYQSAPPLTHAVNDATGIANALRDKFAFPAENIYLLLNEEATRSAILERFLSLAVQEVDSDERILVFFAGHGYTFRSRRGEVGYLVPSDGNVNNLASLIRWDELTRNADLIPAKHVLFIMDACYGGLAITRALRPGSMRFLKDMLLRYSRQVLTAGKADEVVADSGGPLPDHSVFTGHLLEALSGKASHSDGIISANGLMSYIYEHVARDSQSKQTPHFGYLDGDGDFIFVAPGLDELQREEKEGKDLLMAVPAVESEEETNSENVVDRTKEYLAEPRYRIRLHDLVAQEIREVLSQTSEDNFAINGAGLSKEEFANEFASRLKRYEKITHDLKLVTSCISYWGETQHREILTLAHNRLTDRLDSKSGVIIWLALRWYPVILLMYSCGVAAVAAKKYENLTSIFTATVQSQRSSSRVSLAQAIGEAILDIERSEAFKTVPGYEKHYVPRSEYLFKLLQPDLDDLFFLGSEYEACFDKFEVLLALSHAHFAEKESHGHIWGPIGRFGWKYHRSYMLSPFALVVQEASTQKESWAPIAAGLFDGSYTRFAEIAEKYEQFISGLHW